LDFDYVVAPALILLIGILVVWLGIRRMLSLSGKSYQMWRKVAERVVLSAVVVVAAAVAGSASFNAVAQLWFRAHNPPPGETYLVNGHKMHMNCTGSGSPTIVLDAGLGNDSLIWGGVQPVLSRTTRVCSYDRAGFGWSDALPAPRDADHIAVELHELLLQAKVSGPIVLMGHSIAGIYMRDYATRYPADLAGIVFVDASTPLQDENPAFKAMASRGPMQWSRVWLARSGLIVGLPRLMGQCSQPIRGFEAHAGKLQAEDSCHLHIGAVSAELDSFNRSGQETVHTGPYGALPILIFSQDPAKSLPKQNPPRQLVGVEQAWNLMQEDLKRLSTRSLRIIAKGSSHLVQIDRAELIENEVPLFIEQIRGTVPQPTDYGSTVTE
jgi:pimeloyl-ACP methyl ester carboxylesterase